MANSINIDKEIHSKLQNKFPNEIDRPRVRNCRLSSYKVSSVEFTKTDFDFKSDELVYLPEKIYFDIYKNVNCSSERRGWAETLSLSKSISLNRSMTFTKSITSSATLNAQVNFPLGSVGGSVSRSVTVSNSRSWSETETVTENRSRTINLEVNSKKVLFVKLQKIVKSIRVPFSAKLTIDGTFTATYIGLRRERIDIPLGQHIYIERPVHFNVTYRISDVLNDLERTFIIDGFIENSKADDLEVLYDERDVKTEECEYEVNLKVNALELFDNSSEVVLELEEIESNTFGEISDESDYENLSFGLAIEEYFGTTSIQTSNSVANIEVRHLSYGPGFCNVDTRSSLGKTITTAAPPAFWSPWQVLESHIGEISLTISNTVNCDTGVRSQVKYWKK